MKKIIYTEDGVLFISSCISLEKIIIKHGIKRIILIMVL